MKYHRSSHSVWDCRYHIVWTTWRRRKALTLKEQRQYCDQALRRIADEYEMYIQALEVDVDHVHIFIEIAPQTSVGTAVKILKSVSARMMFEQFHDLRQVFWNNKIWAASYFVRSVGEGVTAEMVKRYIQTHEEKSALGPIQVKLNLKARPKG